MSGPRPEQDWFEKAEQNLEMARRAMLPGNPFPEMACYHAQQCAEKYLKGFLVSRSHSFNLVHDLFYLTQECAQRQLAFSELELIRGRDVGQVRRSSAVSAGKFRRSGRRRGLGSNKTSRGSRNLCEEPTLDPLVPHPASTPSSTVPRTGRGRPCACPSPASTPSSTPPSHRPGPVGAGLVPALCLSKSRYTISPTAAAHSSPDLSSPKNELHPDGFGS